LIHVVVDTNVPIVVNRRASNASLQCVLACVRRLRQIQAEQVLVLESGWLILHEYADNLCSEGQPGVGDAFFRWVLTNRKNTQRCQLVDLTPLPSANGEMGFAEFPDSPDLDGFDYSDRKFAAVANAHPTHPPILNAVDSDWQQYLDALTKQGIRVEFLCGALPLRN